jgi:hypothetical protein
LCKQISKSTDVIGDLNSAKCPKCKGNFIPKLEHIDSKIVDHFYNILGNKK